MNTNFKNQNKTWLVYMILFLSHICSGFPSSHGSPRRSAARSWAKRQTVSGSRVAGGGFGKPGGFGKAAAGSKTTGGGSKGSTLGTADGPGKSPAGGLSTPLAATPSSFAAAASRDPRAAKRLLDLYGGDVQVQPRREH